MTKKRIVFYAGVLVVLIAGWFFGFYYGYPYYQGWKYMRGASQFLEEYTQPFKDDKTGGATPEETWEMFLTALKAEDFKTAADLFDVEEQEGRLEWLQEVKENGFLDDMVRDLTVDKLDPVFVYDTIAQYVVGLPGEEVNASISFRKNKFTNLWKILDI